MRRALLVLIGVIAVVGGALFSYSWMSNRAVAAGLEEWADTLRAGGYEVTLGGVSVSGFPSPDLTTVDGIEIAKPGDTFAWRWRAPTVFMTGRFSGAGLRIRVAGTQTLTYRAEGEERTAEFTGRIFEIGLSEGEDGGLGTLSADITGFSLRRHGETEPISARRIQSLVEMGEGGGAIPTSTTAAVQFDDLSMPQHRRGAFGDTIQRLSVEARLWQNCRIWTLASRCRTGASAVR